MITFNRYIQDPDLRMLNTAIRNESINSTLKSGALLALGASEGRAASKKGKSRLYAAKKAAKQGALQGMSLDFRRALTASDLAEKGGAGLKGKLAAGGLSLAGSAIRGAAGGVLGSQLGYRQKDKQLKQHIKNRIGL